ncbi:MAG: ATP-binding protein [Polyangiales bacterium]
MAIGKDEAGADAAWAKELDEARAEIAALKQSRAHDVTEHERVESARHRSLVEWMPEALVVHRRGKLIYVNPAAIKMYGAGSASDLLGKSVLDFIHPEFHQQVMERMKLASEQGVALPPLEEKHFRLDGTSMDVEVHGTPIPFEGGPAMHVVIRDVTERKRAEAEKARLEAQLHQAQKMESIGRLAGGIAHDFNNILGVILGYADAAMRNLDPSLPLYGSLSEIRDAARRSTDLTRQLLAFARRQTVTPQVLDLNETVAGMLTMLRRLIGENVQLKWLGQPGLWPVKVDPSQIDQILANLCANARDAVVGVGSANIETGNCTIDADDCAAHSGAVPGDYVRLAVTDDGCGMDEETLAQVFEPFFTTKGVGKGTGLGLATLYGIVKQNRGFIEVRSEPGHGTTFSIYLPRYVAKPEPAEKPVATASVPPGHETILLVEDEPGILKLTKMVLEEAGYRVLAASTPGEAVRLGREYTGEIHLLFTDVVMPEMNGRELAKLLLSVHPRMKCLFMSGYTADIIAQHGVVDESVSFLQKPFNVDALATRVREVLHGEPAK